MAGNKVNKNIDVDPDLWNEARITGLQLPEKETLIQFVDTALRERIDRIKSEQGIK